MGKVTSLINDNKIVESRKENDTIRLWENYKEQALLWRSLSLLQLPTTFAAIVFALILWHQRVITLNVPRQPMPGVYSATEIPDEIFVEFASNFVNLVGTYTPAVATTQFKEARKMLNAPMLAQFDNEMIQLELKAIVNTSRTQIFFPDPTRTMVSRNGNNVTIELIGERLKMVAGKELPSQLTRFNITMTTIPKNTINPYGIQITGIDTGIVPRR